MHDPAATALNGLFQNISTLYKAYTELTNHLQSSQNHLKQILRSAWLKNLYDTPRASPNVIERIM